MIVYQRYHPETGTVSAISPQQIPELLGRSDVVLWIDLEAPTDAELSWLAETFSFHPLAMEDVRGDRQRIKLDQYESYHFFILRTIEYRAGALEVCSDQLALFLGKNYLVTIHHGKLAALDEVHRRWERAHMPREATVFLFYLISDAIIDSYFPVIDELGDLIDTLDERILLTQDRATIRTIFTTRRNLLAIRKILGPLRDTFNELLRAGEMDGLFSLESTRVYFSDAYDHVLRLTDFVDIYRDMLSGSMEAYQSALSNRLNENMQRMTVAATIIATATVITGFFGMNVHGAFINTTNPMGGYLILAGLLIVMGIELWLFRRIGWL